MDGRDSPGPRFVGLLVCVALVVAGCSSEPESSGWSTAFDADEAGWLMTVAGRQGGPVWAGGGMPDDGTIYRRHDDGWSEAELPDDVPRVNWIHVFDDGSVWAAARGGEILRRSSGEWVSHSTPTEQNLWGVWGANTDDVWAVGGDARETGSHVILRWNDEEWREIDAPELSASGVGAFFKVWGTGPDNVFIVGQNGTVLHWDGETLEEEPVETELDLISLWGSGPDSVTAVGGRANAVLAHWDGSSWTTHSLAPLAGMNGIWVRDETTAWIAGARGTIARLDPTAESPDPEVTRLDTRRDFHAINGVGGMGLFAVGGNLKEPDGPYRGLAYFKAFR